MPLSQLIAKHPEVQMTETTGTIERVEINERTGKPKHKIEHTWCHTKQYFKFRARTTVPDDIISEQIDAANYIRRAKSIQKQYLTMSAEDKEILKKMLEDL